MRKTAAIRSGNMAKDERPTRQIEYEGQVLETVFFMDLTDEEYTKIKNDFYAKPDFEEVKEEFRALSRGSTQHSAITKYYVKDLMYKTRIYYNKWSIEDVFNSKELTGWLVKKTLSFPETYDAEHAGLVNAMETCLRLGGGGVASKPANFPIRTAEEVLIRFNVNNNWWDMSCGWGERLLTALKRKVNYFGTDPNYLLTERLEQMKDAYQNEIGTRSSVDIRTQGSEVFVPEWVGKMGLCFTSPPYFYLEDYRIGNQSYTEGTSYQDWLNNFLRPTIDNCKAYLIDNGYMCINIKDFDGYALEADTQRVAEEEGFVLVEKMNLKNIARITCKNELTENDENIMVFMKKGCEHYYQPPIKEEALW